MKKIRPNGINPDFFAEEYEKHCIKNSLGHHEINDPTREGWRQLATFFNKFLNGGDHDKTTILTLGLGNGKTQGTVFYCALLAELSDEEHPGVLIVVKLQDEVDTNVQEINKYGRRETAIGYHTNMKPRPKLKTIENYPVLVITHEQHKRSNNNPQSNKYTNKWSSLNFYIGKRRRLVIIDEAIGTLDEHKITRDQLNLLKVCLPDDTREKFPDEMALVDYTEECLNQIEWKEKKYNIDPAPIQASQEGWNRFTSTVLRNGKKKGILGDNEEMWDELREALQSIYKVWQRERLSFGGDKEYRERSLSSGEIVFPRESGRAVILDATAILNSGYRTGGYEIIEAPPGARRYDNMEIIVSYGHVTGKTSLVDNETKADRRVGQIMEFVSEKATSENGVLICTHKTLINKLRNKIKEEGRGWYVENWARTAGVNTFRDCDVAFLLGLNWRNPTTMQHDAHQISKDDIVEFIKRGEQGDLIYGEESTKSLNRTVVSRDVIQAIGRTGARRMIDKLGNCERIKIYLLLPDKENGGQTILGWLKKLFPGVRITEDHFDIFRKEVGPDRLYADELKEKLEALKPGRHRWSKIAGNMSHKAQWQYKQRLEDPKDDLGKWAIRHEISFKTVKNTVYVIKKALKATR